MLVLLYHRVAAPAHDPFELSVHPDHFSQHLEHLQRLANVVPLAAWRSKSAAPQIAVTFDDGYADNARVAAPMMQDAGLPATWFITSDLLGGRGFWWDRLAEAFLSGEPRALETRLGPRPLWLDLGTPRARRASLIFMHRRLRPLPRAQLLSEVAQLVAALQPAATELDSRSMTHEELRSLANRPNAEIGAHTRTHVQLGSQTEDVQRDEVIGSVRALEGLIGRAVKSFAYPFGDERSIGDLAPGIVAESGCAQACSTSLGTVRGTSPAFLLPRLTVGNWDGAEFASHLSSWLRMDR